MSSRSHSRAQQPGGAHSVVVRAYRESVRARSVWCGFAGSLRNSEVSRDRDQAHQYLHAATMHYYEVVQPYLSGAPAGSKARDFWEAAPLFPLRIRTEPGVECAHEHRYPNPGAAGMDCPECGSPLQATDVPELNDDGEVLAEWECGLRALQKYVDQTEEIERPSGEWSTGTTTEQVPQLLDPDALLRIARHLDEAAKDLELLANTREERPRAEVGA